MPGRLLFLLAVFSFPILTSAQVYKWTDENGVVHYGDEEPGTTHQQFEFQGYTEVESSTNRQVRSAIQRERREADREDQETYEERRQREAEEAQARKLAKRCEWYEERIEYINNRLRAGYTVSTGNRLRAERRDLSGKRSRECLRGRSY